jgi:hypothetical protein
MADVWKCYYALCQWGSCCFAKLGSVQIVGNLLGDGEIAHDYDYKCSCVCLGVGAKKEYF